MGLPEQGDELVVEERTQFRRERVPSESSDTAHSVESSSSASNKNKKSREYFHTN